MRDGADRSMVYVMSEESPLDGRRRSSSCGATSPSSSAPRPSSPSPTSTASTPRRRSRASCTPRVSSPKRRSAVTSLGVPSAKTGAYQAPQHAVRLGLLLGEPNVLLSHASDDDSGHSAKHDRGKRQVVGLRRQLAEERANVEDEAGGDGAEGGRCRHLRSEGDFEIGVDPGQVGIDEREQPIPAAAPGPSGGGPWMKASWSGRTFSSSSAAVSPDQSPVASVELRWQGARQAPPRGWP